MKKTITIITLLAVVLPAVLPSCKKEEQKEVVKVLSVTVSPETKTTLRGETFTLTATVLPATLPDRKVTWSSMNPEMASVDENGLVKTIRPGITYIVATASDGRTKGSCQLTINYPDRYYVVMQNAAGEDLPATLYGYPGMEMQLSAQSSDGAAHTYSWISSNNEAASVNDSGLLKFEAPYKGRTGYLYYASGTVKVESEDTFSDKVSVVSNILNTYSIGGGVRDFDEDYGVSGGKTYEVSLLWSDGKRHQNLPASLYTVESSDTGAFSVEKDGDVYKITSTASIGAAARLTAKLWNGTQLILGRYTVSDTVSGNISDYTEDNR